jgi:hypothetical protein
MWATKFAVILVFSVSPLQSNRKRERDGRKGESEESERRGEDRERRE